jgi:Zn-dependent protease
VERLSVLSERTPTAGTVRAFRIGGVPVRLHFTFVLLVAFLVVTDLGHVSGGSFALYLLGLFGSVLLHELAHAGMASWLKVRTLEIVMFPIGGLSRMERRLRPGEELWVTLAGPLMNLALAGAIFGYLVASHEVIRIGLTELLEPADGHVLQRLAFANLLLAALNLMPAFPMDGGRVLRALLSYVRPEEEATRMAAWMGRMLAISMGLYGLVFSELLLVFFAFFVWLGAAQRHSRARGNDHGVPQARPRRYGSRRSESAAFDRATGFPHHERRSGHWRAGPERLDAGTGEGRPGRLCRRSDEPRFPGSGTGLGP